MPVDERDHIKFGRGESQMVDSCPHCGTQLPAIRDAFCPGCRGDLAEAPVKPRTSSDTESRKRTLDTVETSLWYATEKRVFGWMKLSWYDDRGAIDASPQGLQFLGQKVRLGMSRVTAVHLEGPVIPWAAVVSMTLGNIFVLLMAKAGAFNYLTLESPATYVLLAGLDVFALASWPMSWVRVDYLDEQGQPDRGYFTVASLAGRWAGGTKRLYAQLRSHSGQTA